MEICKKNAENRKKQIVPHTGGAKANSKRRREMFAKTGKMPGRGEIYLATHKKEDGSYVNEDAREVYEKVQQALNESTTDESIVFSANAIDRVLGKEHPGRLRCVGLAAVPSQIRFQFGGTSNSSTNHSSCSSQCNERYNQLVNLVKSYMIMREGVIPKQFTGFFASSTTQNDAANQSTNASQPLNVTRSSGGSTDVNENYCDV